MIFRMLPKSILLLPILIGLASSAWSQGSSIVVDSDIRLFTTMAALNAAGFDVEFAPSYHPVREEVRRQLRDLDAELADRLRRFYAEHKGSRTDEQELSRYISLALVLSDPAEFEITIPDGLLPPDAEAVARFRTLLREFYEKVRIPEMWAELRPRYEEELNRLAGRLREAILGADAFLKLPLGVQVPGRLAVYLELAAPLNSVNFRNYQDNYYVVLGGSRSPQVDDVRHAYLHFRLDAPVAGIVARIQEKSSLLRLLDGVDGVERQYTTDLAILATESLIRAVELRMDEVEPALARQALDGYYRSGLLLAPYFYEGLTNFESQGVGIREYLRELVVDVLIADEEKRFRTRFHQIPAPERRIARAEIPRPPDPVMELLKEGERALNSDDLETAHTVFERVLDEFDDSRGAALYGLALVASKEGDSGEAKRYFIGTVRSESAEPSMKVWSHIFLGRIYDIECDRDRAVGHYEQAAQLDDDTRNAQSAAAAGIVEPYGGSC